MVQAVQTLSQMVWAASHGLLWARDGATVDLLGSDVDPTTADILHDVGNPNVPKP